MSIKIKSFYTQRMRLPTAPEATVMILPLLSACQDKDGKAVGELLTKLEERCQTAAGDSPDAACVFRTGVGSSFCSTPRSSNQEGVIRFTISPENSDEYTLVASTSDQSWCSAHDWPVVGSPGTCSATLLVNPKNQTAEMQVSGNDPRPVPYKKAVAIHAGVESEVAEACNQPVR